MFLAINAAFWSAVCIVISRPLLDARLAGVVELVARAAGVGLSLPDRQPT